MRNTHRLHISNVRSREGRKLDAKMMYRNLFAAWPETNRSFLPEQSIHSLPPNHYPVKTSD